MVRDAFRFTLAAGAGYSRGLNLDPERIGGYRNFINKVWNAFRFLEPFLQNSLGKAPPPHPHYPIMKNGFWGSLTKPPGL